MQGKNSDFAVSKQVGNLRSLIPVRRFAPFRLALSKTGSRWGKIVLCVRYELQSYLQHIFIARKLQHWNACRSS